MFLGKFSDKSSFRGEGFSLFDTGNVWVGFSGRLHGTTIPTADTARYVAGLYSGRGDSCFRELEGAFVAVIHDGARTLIARDRHGTGPQVYYTRDTYASSLTDIRLSEDYTRPDAGALCLFLSMGHIPYERSSLEGVGKLAPGSLLIHEGSDIRVRNLFEWDPDRPVPSAKRSPDEYAEEYAALHARAIRERIAGSRSVGVLLSGGYDSGCNLAALRAVYDGPVKSYSIGFRGNTWSELPLARCMSEVFGTTHHEYEIDGSEIMELPRIVAHMGDPFVEGGLMVNFAAMRLAAADRSEVILGGDGNDQYFGTSARETAIYYLARHYGLLPTLRLIYRALGWPAAQKSDKAYRVRFHLDKILHILHGDLFGIELQRIKDFLRDPSLMEPPEPGHPDARSFERLYNQHNLLTDIGKVIDRVILFKASQMAGMFGQRVEFPYLSHALYDFLQDLPLKYKCLETNPVRIARGRYTAKYLLKYKYRPMLPEAVTAKKKQGGFAPMPIFFEDRARRTRLEEFIMASGLVRDFLRRGAVERFLGEYEAECTENRWFWRRQNSAIQLFNLLTLAVWWQTFVAGDRDVRF